MTTIGIPEYGAAGDATHPRDVKMKISMSCKGKGEGKGKGIKGMKGFVGWPKKEEEVVAA